MILTTLAEGEGNGIGTSFMEHEVNIASAKRSPLAARRMDVRQFDFMDRLKNSYGLTMCLIQSRSSASLPIGKPTR